MKVAWLHTHLMELNGGVKHILEVAKRLRNHCELDLYVGCISPICKGMFSSNGIAINVLPELYYSSDISFENIKKWFFFQYKVKPTRQHLKITLRNYDVVIASYFPLYNFSTGLGPKSVNFFFEPNPFLYGNNYIKSIPYNKRVWINLFRRNLAKFDLMTPTSDEFVTITQFSSLVGKKIYGRSADVCYPGIDVSLFQKKYDPELAKRYEGYKIILHSASYFSYSKGTHFLMQALPKICEKVPNCKLLIMSCTKDKKARLPTVNLAAKLGVKDNVEFLPFIDEYMLPNYYSLANVVVQPSVYESFSLPLSEGNACETPCISFAGGSTQEQIIDGQNGYVVPLGDTDKLAYAVISILKNPDLAKRMGKAGKERVDDFFTWDKSAECLWELIKR